MKKMMCPIGIIVIDCIFMCRKDYTSNQKPQWCISFMPSFQPISGCLQPPLLCTLLCSEFNQEICWVWDVKESLSQRKLTSEKQSRNWSRIAMYHLFHSHWWEKNCRTTAGRMENYQLVSCFSWELFCLLFLEWLWNVLIKFTSKRLKETQSMEGQEK